MLAVSMPTFSVFACQITMFFVGGIDVPTLDNSLNRTPPCSVKDEVTYLISVN